jgi:capsular polysaccharide biosynthesis protein
MRNIAIGFVLGLVIATVGFSGLARMFDKGIDTVKTQSKELAK